MKVKVKDTLRSRRNNLPVSGHLLITSNEAMRGASPRKFHRYITSLCSLLTTLALSLATGYLAEELKMPQISITKPETTTVKILCEAGVLDDIHWYQQLANQAPRRILRKGRMERDPGVSAKFSAESSDSLFSLVIDNIDLTDAAIYHCAQKGDTKTLRLSCRSTAPPGKGNFVSLTGDVGSVPTK